ncbi:Double-stranded RNA-binding protein 1 [Linum perenne]
MVVTVVLNHSPTFHATVTVNGTTFASESAAMSLKQSHNDVARIAVRELMAAAAAAPVPQPSSGINYKSCLSIYAQRRNYLLPAYEVEQYGPPHSRQFSCSVTVDGQTYSSEEISNTVKEAEQSAAKVAVEALQPGWNGEEQVMYKSMLQVKMQKKGVCLPNYETWKTDQVHPPTFISTVEVEGQQFTGDEARSKKLAENNAAMVAYAHLMEENSSGSQ